MLLYIKICGAYRCAELTADVLRMGMNCFQAIDKRGVVLLAELLVAHLSQKKYNSAQTPIKANPKNTLLRCCFKSFLISSLYKIHKINIPTNATVIYPLSIINYYFLICLKIG